MQPVCECFYEGENPDLFRSKMVKARKLHKCIECNTIITAGEIYERATGKWNGYFDSFATCKICAMIRKDFVPCSSFGELDVNLEEGLGFLRGEIR
jgi:hypothetical protein